MKKIFLTALIASLGSVSAFAADLPARAYTKAPAMVVPVSTWQGFYIGGNVGYGWGHGDTGISFLPNQAAFGSANTTLDPKPQGVIGGAQIGYNWQMGAIVTGLEADIQGSGIKGSATKPVLAFPALTPNGNLVTTNEKLLWFGTVRGRLGFTVTPDLLLYATGGLAYGQADTSAILDSTVVDYPASLSKIKVGWTAGGGAEWMFTRSWSAKIEYMYIDLGKASAIGNPVPANPPFQVGYTWKTQENIVRAGVNYKFGGY